MSPTMKEMKREWEEDELRYGEVKKARESKEYDFFVNLERQRMLDWADSLVKKAKSNNSANDVQVGGEHYKKQKIQTWDFIHQNNIGFLAGNVIKYIVRYKEKNGIEDLKKARHYLDKLIEVEDE